MPRPPVFANPAWTHAALARHWDDLARLVGPRRMPRVEEHTARRLVAQELGSGIYGTVMPSSTPRVVVKVTSDPSEARFAYIARALRPYPPGLVRYGPVYRLHGTHERRPMYVLWREEADDVGEAVTNRTADVLNEIQDRLDPTFRRTYDPSTRRAHADRVADSARYYAGRTGYERGGTPGVWMRFRLALAGGDARAGYGLDAARELAGRLARGRDAPAVGRTIGGLIDRGIVLADVHPGNVGRVRRRGEPVVVITDPGNVGFLTDEFDAAEPPTVAQALDRPASPRRTRTPAPRAASGPRRAAPHDDGSRSRGLSSASRARRAR